mgnify:CR=1 FL=1
MEKAKLDLLVLQMQAGDENAFEQVYRYLNAHVVRFCYQICHQEHTAKDAAQNTWLKMIKNVRYINDPRAFKKWLYQMARWQTLDLVKGKQPEQLPEDVELTLVEAVEPCAEDDLMKLINQLSLIDRQAISLFYLDDLSIKEISQILEVPVGTIKSRLNRARSQLKEKYQAQ